MGLDTRSLVLCISLGDTPGWLEAWCWKSFSNMQLVLDELWAWCSADKVLCNTGKLQADLLWILILSCTGVKEASPKSPKMPRGLGTVRSSGQGAHSKLYPPGEMTSGQTHTRSATESQIGCGASPQPSQPAGALPSQLSAPAAWMGQCLQDAAAASNTQVQLPPERKKRNKILI